MSYREPEVVDSPSSNRVRSALCQEVWNQGKFHVGLGLQVDNSDSESAGDVSSDIVQSCKQLQITLSRNGISHGRGP
jgi:hypothetical protein